MQGQDHRVKREARPHQVHKLIHILSLCSRFTSLIGKSTVKRVTKPLNAEPSSSSLLSEEEPTNTFKSKKAPSKRSDKGKACATLVRPWVMGTASNSSVGLDDSDSDKAAKPQRRRRRQNSLRPMRKWTMLMARARATLCHGL
jgi:hypothetical protein